MKTVCRIALLAAVAGVLSVPAASPSYAHWSRHHYRHHAVHHGWGSYAYAPRHVYSGSRRNERQCSQSPSSPNFVPCLNRP